MQAIDTNVLVRLLVRDDEQQVTRADAFVVHGAWVSSLVLAESVWVLESVYERSAKQIATVIHMLLNHAQLVLQDPDVVEKALASYQNNTKVGFTDHFILATAQKAGHTPLASFDKAFAKLEGVKNL